jgi:hypothetical protein
MSDNLSLPLFLSHSHPRVMCNCIRSHHSGRLSGYNLAGCTHGKHQQPNIFWIQLELQRLRW